MSNPYVGEIRMFAGNFAPVDWAFCNGQSLSISQNAALFNLLGTTYGGNGTTTFNLPDLQGRFPMHMGSNFEGDTVVIGQESGQETVVLSVRQLPVHTHTAVCAAGGGNVASPSGAYWSTDPQGNTAAYNETGGSSMAAGAIGSAGSGTPHDNRQPYLAVSFIIALFGIYPSQG